MAKQNTKSSLNNSIDKNKLYINLDNLAKNVANRGLYFVAKRKSGSFDVVDIKTKQPIFKEVVAIDIADRIAHCLNKTTANTYNATVQRINAVLRNYTSILTKHVLDIVHYEHIMKTTSDVVTYDSVEARISVSRLMLENLINTVISKLR